MKKEAEKLTSSQRGCLPDSAFALVFKNTQGETVRKYPVHDKNHVKAAINFFGKHSSQMPSSQRVSTARNISSAARSHQIPIESGQVAKYASETPDIENIKNEIEARYGLAHSEKEQIILTKIAKLAAEKDDYDGFILALEAFDKESGNDRLWGTKLAEPSDVVFTGINKIARDPEFMEKVKRNRKVLSMYLGKALVNNIIEGRLTINDLDSDIARLLKRLLR